MVMVGCCSCRRLRRCLGESNIEIRSEAVHGRSVRLREGVAAARFMMMEPCLGSMIVGGRDARVDRRPKDHANVVEIRHRAFLEFNEASASAC